MTGIGFRIRRNPPRTPAATVALLRGIPTALISDNCWRTLGAGAGLRPMHRGGALLGSALTVRTRPGDNLMIHKAIDLAQPGDVLVIDAGGALDNAVVGEILVAYAISRGVAGIVVDGAIRDSEAIGAGDFPVFARGVTHRGPWKDGPGEIGYPVQVAGQIVNPGDIVVGDGDGVLAIDPARAVAIADAAHAQLRKEAQSMAAIADGSFDRSWLDPLLRARGCQFDSE